MIQCISPSSTIHPPQLGRALRPCQQQQYLVSTTLLPSCYLPEKFLSQDLIRLLDTALAGESLEGSSSSLIIVYTGRRLTFADGLILATMVTSAHLCSSKGIPPSFPPNIALKYFLRLTCLPHHAPSKSIWVLMCSPFFPECVHMSQEYKLANKMSSKS